MFVEVTQTQKQVAMTRGRHVLWTMGSDFQYQNAQAWYDELDKLVHGY